MSAEFDFDWGTSAARAPKAKKAVKEVKPKVDATIVTQSTHNCKSKHKTYETFIKCALRKYNYNQVQKAALPQVTVKGDGEWATVHESLSEVYASFSYDTEQEYLHQHQNLEVILFRTVEEAAEWQKFQQRFCQSKTHCSNSCNSKGMWGYVSKIVL
jgi:hypothetical protein